MALDLLWEITLGSWVTAALILLARLLFGRWLTARGKYLLWLPLLLRLLLPFMPPSPTSMLNALPETLVGAAAPAEDSRAPDGETWGSPLGSGGEETGDSASVPPAREKGDEGLRLRLLRIWLAGLGAVLLFQLLLYRIGAKAMGSLPPCTDPETRSVLLRLRQLTGIDGSLRMAWGSAGMLGGLLRPTLVLPVDRRKEAAAPILLHELMHQKYGHLWLGLALRLLAAVYWFNPVVWLCLPLVRQDCEELCDQMVLDTGLIDPREYSAILYTEGQMNGLLSPLPRTNFGGRRGSLRRRIGQIARRRSGRESRFLPLCLALCILLCGATAPLGSIQEEERSPIPPSYGSMEAYLRSLHPYLGRFGATFRELEAEGYLKEEEGEWTEREEDLSAFTLRRELYGAERELTYTFVRCLFPEQGDRMVLFQISIEVTEEERDQDLWSNLGYYILEDWEGLDAAYRFEGWYAAPVDTAAALGEDLCRRASEEAAALGFAEKPEDFLEALSVEPVVLLKKTYSFDRFILWGLGLALYENRPAA